MKVLLVEDNEINRDMLMRRLMRRKFNVNFACDGKQAIQMAINYSPDIILMDMSLPKIDGWNATYILKSIPRTKMIPIIALTAHTMAEDKQKAKDAGCDDYDTKPIDINRLLKKIDNLYNKFYSKVELCPEVK